MIKKQRLIIIICAAVVAIMAVLYFAVLRPIINRGDDVSEPPKLLPGELLGSSDRILMFEHVEKAEIDSIKVHNQHGDYEFYRTNSENFSIRGLEGVPYSAETLSSLVVSTGYALSISRIEEDCQNMSEFGLAPEDNPSYYILKKLDGTEHKVYIGNKLLSGGGYYCRYEGRNAVYAMDTSYDSTVLLDIYDLVQPILGYPISSNAYAIIDDFNISKLDSDGICSEFVWIDRVDEGENSGLSVLLKMLYPTDYPVNSKNYSSVTGILGNFKGEKVMTAGPVGESLDFDMLKSEYGIDVANPAYEISYSISGVTIKILFSSQDDDGYMYAYTSLYNMVVKINISSAKFLDWDLIEWVGDTVYQEDIDDISELSIVSDQVTVTFLLEGEGKDLVVRPSDSGKNFDKDEVANFRKFYTSILIQVRRGYADSTDTDESKLIATISMTFKSGEKREYKYYAYSTRRCFYTINGDGEFYMLRDELQKILNDAERVLNGEQVDYEDKN